jgi:hypothetical protein
MQILKGKGPFSTKFSTAVHTLEYSSVHVENSSIDPAVVHVAVRGYMYGTFIPCSIVLHYVYSCR